MMHVLFADWDNCRLYTAARDELVEHIATRTPQWVVAITGLPIAVIVDFARLFGRRK